MKQIDLRSDTVTLPTAAMLGTISVAPLGDDGRRDSDGKGGDETVNRLEELAARMTGKEAAVLFPTGTMANTAAVYARCMPGDRVLVEDMLHLYASEKVAFDPRFGRLTPVFYRLTQDGTPDVDSVREALAREEVKLICVENSHNYAGGACTPPDGMRRLYEAAAERQVPVHLDGARLFNAACALGVEARELCRYADSVMFCLSKGLGAPVGSMLCGTREFCAAARRLRKLLGGTMRQAGVIAAPGIYALEHNVARLREDHIEAARFAGRIGSEAQRMSVRGSVQTNMVILDVSRLGMTRDEFLSAAAQAGVLASAVPHEGVRFVFHLGIGERETNEAVDRLLDLERRWMAGTKTDEYSDD